jgi:hypothetical protein
MQINQVTIAYTLLATTSLQFPSSLPFLQPLLKCLVNKVVGALNLHTMVNSRNTTPLTVACTSGASRKVLQQLLTSSSPPQTTSISSSPPKGLESGGYLRRSRLFCLPPFYATPGLVGGAGVGSMQFRNSPTGSRGLRALQQNEPTAAASSEFNLDFGVNPTVATQSSGGAAAPVESVMAASHGTCCCGSLRHAVSKIWNTKQLHNFK